VLTRSLILGIKVLGRDCDIPSKWDAHDPTNNKGPHTNITQKQSHASPYRILQYSRKKHVPVQYGRTPRSAAFPLGKGTKSKRTLGISVTRGFQLSTG
jgi:hypothetical protein